MILILIWIFILVWSLRSTLGQHLWLDNCDDLSETFDLHHFLLVLCNTLTETAMFKKIFLYVDRYVRCVGLKKLVAFVGWCGQTESYLVTQEATYWDSFILTPQHILLHYAYCLLL
jgi:hypothetical protein